MKDSGAERQQDLMLWSRRVAECHSSGMTVERWCAEHGINPKTYYRWQTKVKRAAEAEAADVRPRFVELPTAMGEPAARRNDIVASVRVGGASFDVYDGADAEIVSALCKVLSHAE